MKTIKIVNQQKRGLKLFLSIQRNDLVLFFPNWLPRFTLVVSNIIAGRQTKCQILWHVYGLTQGVMIAFGQRIDLFTRTKAMTSNNKTPRGQGRTTDTKQAVGGQGTNIKQSAALLLYRFMVLTLTLKTMLSATSLSLMMSLSSSLIQEYWTCHRAL